MRSNATSKIQIDSHFLCIKTTEAGKGPLLALKCFSSTDGRTIGYLFCWQMSDFWKALSMNSDGN